MREVSFHVIRKEAGLFCRISSSVRLWWELEEPKGPKGSHTHHLAEGLSAWSCWSCNQSTVSALHAVKGWEDLLSLAEWRLTGAYLFGSTSPTFLVAETEQEQQGPCGKELDEGGPHVQRCAKHARGAWPVGHNEVQGGWKQAGEEAGFTARVGVKHGLLHELHTAGKMYDIRYTPTDQNLRDLTPILADISLTHPFIGNAVDRDRWGTYQRKNLSQRAQSKSLKHAWAENVHGVVPFVSDTLGSMAGESAATLCLFAWCQAELEAEFFAEDWGNGARTDDGTSVLMEASKRDLR